MTRILKALRWLVDRLARPVVIGSLIVLCWTVLASCWALWRSAPVMAGLVASHAGMLLAGVCWRDRRLKALAVVSEWHDEEIGAIKLADTLADKRQISGEHPQVQVYDWAQEPFLDEQGRLDDGFGDPWTPAKSADLLSLNTERAWRLRDREADR